MLNNEEMIKELEYLIDNNLFHEPIQIHTCPILKEHIIQYKLKNKIVLANIVENTFNKYFDDIKEEKRLYELEEDFNPFFSEERYKSHIPKDTIEKLKKIYFNKKLDNLEEIISSIKYPYFDYLLRFLHSINHILYMKKTYFEKSHEYTIKNYDKKTTSKQNDAKKNFDINNHDDAKLHKNLIKNYQDDKIIGSVIISSITNKAFNQIARLDDMFEFTEKDKELIKRNQHFNMLFEKMNFTKIEMINGYAQACYWNYAQASFKAYKHFRKIYNKKYQSSIPYIRKDMISNDIIELFNTALNNEEILQIRQNKNKPNLLKVVDGINIYVVKDISDLEKEFYDFIVENFLMQNDKIKNFIKENEELTFKLTKQFRHLFY